MNPMDKPKRYLVPKIIVAGFLLHRIQQLTVERVMFAPIYDFRALHGVGPRVAEHTINAIPMHPFPSYEDMRLKER
jgi:hypothetical protein